MNADHVYATLSEQALKRTSPENVRDVLAALDELGKSHETCWAWVLRHVSYGRLSYNRDGSPKSAQLMIRADVMRDLHSTSIGLHQWLVEALHFDRKLALYDSPHARLERAVRDYLEQNKIAGFGITLADGTVVLVGERATVRGLLPVEDVS